LYNGQNYYGLSSDHPHFIQFIYPYILSLDYLVELGFIEDSGVMMISIQFVIWVHFDISWWLDDCFVA